MTNNTCFSRKQHVKEKICMIYSTWRSENMASKLLAQTVEKLRPKQTHDENTDSSAETLSRILFSFTFVKLVKILTTN